MAAETIGHELQAARLDLGMTIDDLQQQTRIQRRYLLAIEDGRFEVLPGPFYIQAFIKQYADAVGLNGNILLRQHQDEIPKNQVVVNRKVRRPLHQQSLIQQVSPLSRVEQEDDILSNVTDRRTRRFLQIFPVAALFGMVMIILLSIVIAMFFY
ncbi:helix-turn-helix domain-containing protein [Limosilactobacillus gastricus]|uniref:Transcriptional regulator n=1 Tax=Limosilactobacillus gastricus DSM 16045 TaxID=1423749 RepID=A0A0R1VDP4_9LACO|nr:helix-turn-helix domain-containing protein [Limosilactobacillus gastricus]KRM03471.1 hypothetical protein FC60_GL000793 [Limosilactobacillus gastricus DSM 16045]QGF40820.1 helix-turn-helix domain-containing protein [Limosilactobacillus gastricus]